MSSIDTAAQAAAALAVSSPSWRPPQWSQPAMVQIIVPPQKNNTKPVPTDTNIPVVNGQFTVSTSPGLHPSQVYVFDAVFSLEHSQELEATQHPVQSGANISSHAYLRPPTVSMFIGMSDAMQQYAAGGTNLGNLISAIQGGNTASTSQQVTPWAGPSSSKSVNAYQQLLTLQQSRIPLTIVTRLRTYNNMIIRGIDPVEDARTITSLRARVMFQMIITASTSNNPVSALPNDTESTGLGTVNSTSPNNTTISQFTPSASTKVVNIPGAGILSSNSAQSAVLQNLLKPDPIFPKQ